MKTSILLTLAMLIHGIANAQDTGIINKTGWLFYYGDKVVWVEASLSKKAEDKIFFSQSEYYNGLVINYIPLAKFYKSIAKGYEIKSLNFDNTTKKSDYTLNDSIWLLPVKVKLTRLARPVSEILTPMALSFKGVGNEMTVHYNFETNYDIVEVGLLRKSDKKKLRRVKNYEVFPPH